MPRRSKRLSRRMRSRGRSSASPPWSGVPCFSRWSSRNGSGGDARVIVVDGSYGEGGGQLLRMAAALSALRGVPVTVTRIRSGRPNPGLAAQHVTALQAVAALCGANVEGLEIGSKEIVIRPGPIEGGRHSFDVGTAGSITLVLQACLPVAFAAREPVRLQLSRGAAVRWA